MRPRSTTNPRPDRSSTRSSSAREIKASAAATSVRSSRASSASRRPREGRKDMLERLVFGTVPRKHHIQLRDAKGSLRYEECLTQEGFEGPYTICYHERPPHTQKVAEVGHGWKLPVAVKERPLAKRHYKSQELKR